MREGFLRRTVLFLAMAAVVPACGGGGGSFGGGSPIPDFVTAGAGGLTITTRGGTGAAGDGGMGGSFNVAATSGSDVHLLSGPLTANTSFNVPAVTPYLGTNPRSFLIGGGANQTLSPADGVRTIPGDDPTAVATGLHLGPGVTLKIQTNDPAGPGVHTGILLSFANGIFIEGDLVVAQTDLASPNDEIMNNAASLVVSCGGDVVVAAGGSIRTAGRAGDGGFFTSIGGNGGQIVLDTAASIVVRGSIDTRGGAGSLTAGDGGIGGAVRLTANGPIYCTASISTSGGDGLGGTSAGGAGGIIALHASNPSAYLGETGVFVAANLAAQGGNGPSLGGAGGGIWLTSGSYGGSVVYAGTADGSGGDALVNGTGGRAGVIQLASMGRNVRCAGSLIARGGTGAAGNPGGPGGPIIFIQQSAGSEGLGPPDVSGGMAISANLATDGASGDIGSDGGDIWIVQSLDTVAPGLNPLFIVGYASADTSGGDGSLSGGNSGSVLISNLTQTDSQQDLTIGGIENSVSLIARGGAAGAGNGGRGGAVFLHTDLTMVDTPSPKRRVLNRAAIDSRGGDGGTFGGTGGQVTLYDHFSAENQASIISHGGAAGTGNGGEAGSISVLSEVQVMNSGALTANGGASGNASGGRGGFITVTTYSGSPMASTGSAVNTGVLTSVGGDGSVSGGDGGSVVVYDHYSASNSGALTTQGGAGGTGDGGTGGAIEVYSNIATSNTAPLVSNGGASTAANGGKGGIIMLAGQSTRHSGNCASRGGTGSLSGGDGGVISFVSLPGPTPLQGAMTVSGGAGTPPGIEGHVYRDGFDQSLVNGSITY